MNLDSLKKLPLAERIAEFRKIREKFISEKSQLSTIIEKLEKAVKEREMFAKNLSGTGRAILKNEVKALARSIKTVKARLDAKNEELKLVESAINEAEQNIQADERQLAESKREEKTMLEMMITGLGKTEQTRQVKELEQEIQQAEIPEEVKKEIEKNTDYMLRQNENFYKAETSLFEQMQQPAYSLGSQREEEHIVPVRADYETDEKGRRRVKEQKEDYKR